MKSSFSPFRLLALLLGLVVLFSSACKTTQRLDDVTGKNTGNAPAGNQTPPPGEKPGTQVAPKPTKRDTVVVMDTLRHEVEWIVLRQAFVDGKRLKSDTVRYERLRPEKLAANPKESYTLAVIMPFRSGEYLERDALSKRSYLALDFYEGMKMAVNDLENENISLKLLVLDSEPDSLGFEPVLLRPELQTCDAIMGPVSSEQLRLTAELAKRYQIPLVSPVNPKENLVKDNPFYIQLSPGTRTQIAAEIDYARQRYGKNAHFVMALPNDSMTIEIAKSVQAHFQATGDGTSIPEYRSADARFKWEDFRGLLSARDTNVVIIPSSDETFVPAAIRALASSTGYRFAVFGTQRWFELNRISMDDLEKLGVFIPIETYLSAKNEAVLQWRYRYFQTYRFPPSEYVCKGYDYTRFICRMLKKYGTNFRYHAGDEIGDYISCSGFQLLPAYEQLPAENGVPARTIIRQFENRRVNILQFREFQYQKIH